MLFASLVLVGIAAGISLIASAIAAASHFLTRSYALSLTLGTLTMPALLLASFTYWLMTMEARIGHYFKRLTMIENTFGDTDYHLRRVTDSGGLM